MPTIVLPFAVHRLSAFRYDTEIAKTWRHSSRQILWFTKANGHYTVDSELYTLTGSEVYFPPPGSVQRLYSGVGLEGYLFSFRSDVLEGAIEAGVRAMIAEVVYRCVRILLIDEPLSESRCLLQTLADTMVRECEQPQPTSPDLLNSLFSTFVLCLQRTACRTEIASPVATPLLFRQFYDKLEQQFAKERTVAGYAAKLATTSRQLSEVVRKVTGISASKYISQRAAVEAKRLALYTDHNMKSISYQLGFPDLAHFSRFFKRSTGMSFTDFKKKIDRDTIGFQARPQICTS